MNDDKKCGLECIRTNAARMCVKPEKGQCPRCKQLMEEAQEHYRQLEASYSQVSKALCNKENATLDEVLQAVRQVKNQLQAYEESAIKCCYESRCNKEINALYECCNRLEKELEAVKRERDAAVDSLRGDCRECKFFSYPGRREPCASCPHWQGDGYMRKSMWQWKGVCPENTEVQDAE